MGGEGDRRGGRWEGSEMGGEGDRRGGRWEGREIKAQHVQHLTILWKQLYHTRSNAQL